MAKTPKVKKREVSLHSRAARRGEAPPSKDLGNVKAPVEETDYKPWLHSAQNAGISKKKNSKPMTHAQKTRHSKALEKAELNADRLEKKVGDSKKRARKVQARRADWEELNGKLGERRDEKKITKSESDKKPVGGDLDLVLPDSEQSPPLPGTDVSAVETEVPVEEQNPTRPEEEEVDEVI